MSGRRVTALRNALFELSLLCSQSGQGGVATEALELLLAAIGIERGALYVLEGGELSLVSQWGMPASLRDDCEYVTMSDRSWFPAARAAAIRKLVLARPGIGGAVLPQTMVKAGWGRMCAVPLVIGRRAIGVSVFASDRDEHFDDDARIFLETAAGMLALTFALNREQERARSATEGFGWRKEGRAPSKERASTPSKERAPTPSKERASTPSKERASESRRNAVTTPPPGKPKKDTQDRKATVRDMPASRGPTARTVPGMASVSQANEDKKVAPTARRRSALPRSGRPSGKKTAVDLPAQKKRSAGSSKSDLPLLKKKL